jgi:type IV pilus assembly protein PilW
VSAEELVVGVEDFQIAYGVDTSDPADGTVDFIDPDGDGDPYLKADQIDANVPGADVKDRWGRIASVRISLLMRSVDNNVVVSPQTYTYNGATVTATDRRLRKVFTHVVKVRNR